MYIVQAMKCTQKISSNSYHGILCNVLIYSIHKMNFGIIMPIYINVYNQGKNLTVFTIAKVYLCRYMEMGGKSKTVSYFLRHK